MPRFVDMRNRPERTLCRRIEMQPVNSASNGSNIGMEQNLGTPALGLFRVSRLASRIIRQEVRRFNFEQELYRDVDRLKPCNSQ